MARRKPWEVSELWAVIEPLLPKHERAVSASGAQADR
jgi:hypothetical protein